MGCLPLLLLFPLGCGLGYLVSGQTGALWGAGIGFLAGLLAMALLIKALRDNADGHQNFRCGAALIISLPSATARRDRARRADRQSAR